jgi:chemotaxis response regulator CheB
LADDSEIMRKAIARLLKGDPEIQVLAEDTSFSQTMQRTEKLHPQILVMDLHMADENDVTPSQIKSPLAGSLLLTISF